MTSDNRAALSLDEIFTEVGSFGLYQVINYILICIPSIISATFVVNYMFSANTLTYRCKVPGCDIGSDDRSINYEQTWLSNAIPKESEHYDDCLHFVPIYEITNTTLTNEFECSKESFDTSAVQGCSKFIYSSDEKNVQTEFGIHCSDTYKLALIGTINNLGRFMFLPISGFLADRFGRLNVIIFGTLCSATLGIIKSFSFNYTMYLILEFFEASAGTCTFGGIYILGIEWVNSKYRVLGSTIITLTHPVGEMLLGTVAYFVHDFRLLIRILYTPALLIVFYFWLVPESVRWLLVNGKVDRAIKILKRTASVNGRNLSETSIELIRLKYAYDSTSKSSMNKEDEADDHSLFHKFRIILRSKILCMRFLNGCYQWMTCCFCFYGLSLFATHVPSENRYTSFLFVTAVEIPSVLLALPLLNRFRRKRLLIVLFLIGSITINIAPWIPKGYSTLTLLFFMLGKAAITIAFTTVYIFTAEQWPTSIRSTVLNSSSMIGRTGSMLSPVVVLLAGQLDVNFLPPILFGGSAFIAACLVIFSPETYQKKLPETIEEAKYI